MFKKLKLQNRIYLGFVIVGFIATSIAVLSIAGFFYTNQTFKDFLSFYQKSYLISDIAYDVAEIKRHSVSYTYGGHKNSAIRIYERYQHISEQIKQHPQKELLHLDKIKKHLDAYIETFSQVEKQRNLQADLVHHKIRQLASKVEQSFQLYLQQESKQKSDIASELVNQKVINSLLLIEKYSIRYFESLDARNVNLAKKTIAKAKKDLDNLRPALEQKTAKNLLQTIDAMNEYEQVFLEIVQRTRGYLFLVNVVMAAEAYEILYYSKKVTNNLNQEMKDIEVKVLKLMQQVLIAILSSSIIFFILMAVFSTLIARSITEPIEKLTTAFKALAKGSHKTKIPTYSIDDEIGALTQAAQVFKDKNKQTEDLLDESKGLMQKLERSNKELEQFVYTVSHDLKSPLVTSMGFIGIIQKLMAAGKTEEAIQKLERIVIANRRMGELINDLLELSRIGRMEVNKKPLDLNQLLKRFYQDHEHRLKEARVTMEIEPDLPILYANESRILQIFENLLSNSLKYGLNPTHSVIKIGKKEQQDSYLIYFKDNGQGVEKEYQQKIFGLFYRLNQQKEGTGIGLAVATKVMQFHNGKIWLESELGKGACFYLEFSKNKE